MRLWRTIKNHLLPWHGNAHRPHLLRRQWLVAFLGLALVSEGLILGHTALNEGPHVFLAAVVRSDVIAYTVEERVAQGGVSLQESGALSAAAQAKADDMAAKGYFSHVGPSGEQPWVWLERQGYDYLYAGENLAVKFHDSKDVVDAWMASPKHRANIVKPQYTQIGVGLAEGMYKGAPATFVVQFFASPASQDIAAAVPAAEPAASAPSTAIQEAAPAAPAVAGAEAPASAPSAQGMPAAAQQPQSPVQSAARGVTTLLDGSGAAASWILGGVTALLIAVLALTFLVRIQVQPTDLLLPGAAVALALVMLIGANAQLLPATGSQSAGVAESAGGDVASGAAVERVPVVFPQSPSR